jgi:N-methylhydantoinase B
VRFDVVEELITLAAARDDYGVVIDPASMAVDEAATTALRAQMRAGHERQTG